MPIPELDGLLNANQAAHRVGLSRNTFYKALSRHPLAHAAQVGNRKLYAPDALDKWAESRPVPGRPRGARVQAEPGWLTAHDLATALAARGLPLAVSTIHVWVNRGKITGPDRPGNNGSPSLWRETTAHQIVAQLTDGKEPA